MAVYIPSTTFAPRTITLGLTAQDRRAVEAQIEALIDLLDTLDGDADMEDDDPAGDDLDKGEMRGYLQTLPIYTVDQTQGPTNHDEAYEAEMYTAQAA